jgi:hypothetical protein
MLDPQQIGDCKPRAQVLPLPAVDSRFLFIGLHILPLFAIFVLTAYVHLVVNLKHLIFSLCHMALTDKSIHIELLIHSIQSFSSSKPDRRFLIFIKERAMGGIVE